MLRRMWSGLIKDKELLGHILEEIDFLMENCSGTEMQDIMDDKVLSRACLKSLEIIGEASRHISEELKKAHPEVAWREMTGMRNKLVHHYFGVDWEIVDDVIKNELPELRSNILRLSLEQA
jgi:uncharacterized protein with HEPN domain